MFFRAKLMSSPGCFLPAVPWAPPGWRTPAARSSSLPADPLPEGSSWCRALSCRSGGLLCDPGRSCRFESSLICLWCQSEEGEGRGGRRTMGKVLIEGLIYVQNCNVVLYVIPLFCTYRFGLAAFVLYCVFFSPLFSKLYTKSLEHSNV